jgi:glutathione S-transferase
MIVVHHLEDSRSQRILWLLEELELEYEIKHYARDAKTSLAPESLNQVHPLGRSPVITDGDVTVAESGAIIEYLVDRYGKGRLIPEAGTPERLRYTYWLHYAEGSLMPLLLLKLIFDRMSGPPVPLLIRPVSTLIAAGFKGRFIKPRLKQNLDYLESELEKNDWFAGEQMTAADVQMSFPLEAAVSRAGVDESRPRLLDFVQRIHAREAYQRALERGGPYAYGH